MGSDLRFALVAFTAVLFVVDPFAATPIFLSITRRDNAGRRRQIARRAVVATYVTLTVFAVAGGFIFQAFGISLGAFKVAGGLLLLLMAIDMMRAQPSRTRTSEEEQRESIEKEDVAVVPLAIPILAGPGAIATVMVLMSRAAWHPWRTASVLGAIALTCVCAWIVFRSAVSAERLFSKNAQAVLERIMGLLLAAVAVEFMLGGLRDYGLRLSSS